MSNFTKSKQNVDHWMSSDFSRSSPAEFKTMIPKSRKFLVACTTDWSFSIQFIPFIMMPVHQHYLQARSFQHTAWDLSRTVFLVLRADVDQAYDFFMSTKLIESQASKRL